MAVLSGALNNAEWCELVCRSHGLPTRFDDDLWVSLHRSPPWYPDAVTLRPGVAASDVIARIDTSSGCSVKDSFADLDLASSGFRVLFEAQWVHRPAGPAPASAGPEWREVSTPEQVGVWIAAHGGGGNIRPSVLDHPLVTVFAAYDGEELVGGAVTNRSDGCVGVSNVFGVGDPALVWPGAIAAIAAHHPSEPLVGYEDGASLEAAVAAGFAAAGPLRVWIKD